MKRTSCAAAVLCMAASFSHAQPVWEPAHTFTLADARIVHLQSIGNTVVVSTAMSALYRSKPDGTLEAVLLVLGNSISEAGFRSEADWLVGGENTIYYTENTGTNWRVESTPFERLVSATAWVGDVMYIGTDDYHDMRNVGRGLGIWRSFDKGRTWEAINEGLTGDAYITKMATDKAGNVWAAMTNVDHVPADGLFRWNDSGRRWERAPLGVYDGQGRSVYTATSVSVHGFSVLADGSIWVGFSGVCSNFACSGVNMSTDNGQTWTSVPGIPDLPNHEQPTVNDVIVDPEYGLLAPLSNYHRGIVEITHDGPWSARTGNLPRSPNSYETYRMATTADGRTWAARRLDKTLYRLGKVGTDIDDERPADFKLSAYPNPFNPATVLAFDLPSAGHVTVHVYDQVGRLAATLADRNFAAGSHRITWNAQNAASGVYLFRITAAGQVRTLKATHVR